MERGDKFEGQPCCRMLQAGAPLLLLEKEIFSFRIISKSKTKNEGVSSLPGHSRRSVEPSTFSAAMWVLEGPGGCTPHRLVFSANNSSWWTEPWCPQPCPSRRMCAQNSEKVSLGLPQGEALLLCWAHCGQWRLLLVHQPSVSQMTRTPPVRCGPKAQ